MNSANEIWLSITPVLQEKFTDIAFKTWFGELEPLDFQLDKLVLSGPSDFKAKMINERFRPDIMQILKDLFAADIDVTVLGPEEAGAYRSAPGTEPAANQNILMGSEEYTFDRFIVGSSNRFAYNAALAVAEDPGKSYNPLFLYGESGLGKTHLLYSIYHTIKEHHPDYQIIYIKGDEFTNELSEAIRLRKTDAFRQKYRDKDLLLVDDIHFIAGKEQTQEEFFNTFNNLYEAGRQIVLTCQVSMYIIRSITNLSLPEVGKFFGQHHTTVMHSVEKIEKTLGSNGELKEVIRDIKANVNDRF